MIERSTDVASGRPPQVYKRAAFTCSDHGIPTTRSGAGVVHSHLSVRSRRTSRLEMSSIVAHAREDQSVVSVIETEHQRFLLSDDHIMGCEHRHPLVRDQIAFSGFALLATVAFLHPKPTDALCLGLGAGTVPHFLRSMGIHTDIIEVDAATIRFAQDHFLFGTGHRSSAAQGTVMHGDALNIIATSDAPREYDVIVSDLWSGAHQGRSLMRSFFARVHDAWLRDGGVLAVNLVAFVDGPHVQLTVDVVRTLRSVFGHVESFVEFDPAVPRGAMDEPANVLLLASDTWPIRHVLPGNVAAAIGEPLKPGSMDHLFANFRSWVPPRLHEATQGREGRILRSDGDWDARLPERDAIARGMRAQQEALLPAETWRVVAELRHVPAPAPAAASPPIARANIATASQMEIPMVASLDDDEGAGGATPYVKNEL